MPAWSDGAADAGPAPTGSSPVSLPVRWLRAFGRFWWDFLVGDTPELFVAVLVIVGITALLVANVSGVVAWATMPVLVVAALTVSVLRGRRSG
jgi:hypothetical protein